MIEDRNYVMVSVGEDWEPDPFPGSLDGQQQGCVCPQGQPEDTRRFVFATDCPVHELSKPKPS